MTTTRATATKVTPIDDKVHSEFKILLKAKQAYSRGLCDLSQGSFNGFQREHAQDSRLSESVLSTLQTCEPLKLA